MDNKNNLGTIALLDILMIFFIFLNVFLIEIRIWIFILLVFFGFLAGSYSWETILFLIKSYFIAIVLFAYSFFNGNKVQFIIQFLSPFSFLMIIPVFETLFRVYGVRRYINLFAISILFLAIYLMSLAFLFFVNGGMVFDIAERHDLVHVSFTLNPIGLARITLKTMAFFILLFLYIKYFIDNKFIKFVTYTLIILALIITQTFGLLIGLFCYSCIDAKLNKRNKLLFVYSVFAVIGSIYFLMNYKNIMGAGRVISAIVKFEQITNVFHSLNSQTLLFGNGVGAVVAGLDSRTDNNESIMIEVFPVILFFVGGIIFSPAILYVYVYPAIKGCKRIFKKFDKDLYFLASGQLTMVASSFTNPYIWGGGSGLLLISMLIAMQNSARKMKHIRSK